MLRIRQKHLRLISRRFWGTIFSLVIAFAVLLQVARQAFPLVNDYRHVVERELGAQLGVIVEIEEISAQWQGLRPRVHLKNLSVLNKERKPIFSVHDSAIELSILDSILQRGMAWRRIIFRDFSITFRQKESGAWKIAGYDGGTANTQNQFNYDDPLDIFLFGRRVEILDAVINFDFLSGQKSQIDIPKISLENDRFFHRLVAQLEVDEEARALEFVLEGYGDPRDEREFTASGYLNLNEIPSRKLLSAVTGKGWDEIDLAEDEDRTLNLELWFKGAPHFGLTINGYLRLNGSPVDEIKSVTLPNKFSASISGAWHEENGWFVNLQDLDLEWIGKKAPLDIVSVYGKGKNVGLRIPEVDVGAFSDLLLEADVEELPDIEKALRDLNVRGYLKNVDIQLRDKSEGYFLASAYVENGHSSTYLGTPEFSNLNGYVEASLNQGYFDVNNGRDVGFFPTKIYDEAIIAKEIDGQVQWKVLYKEKRAYIRSNLISAKIRDSLARGYVALELPFSQKYGEPEMTMAIGADKLAIADYQRYVPNKIPQDLNDWLGSALLEGGAKEIGIFYHGSLEKDPAIEPNFQLFGRAENLDLKFDPSWPQLSKAYGSVYVDNNDVYVQVDSGQVSGNEIESATIKIVPSEVKSGDSDRSIIAEGSFGGEVSAAKKFLLESPIRDSVDDFLLSWDLSGTHASSARLEIPMSFIEDDIKYDIQAELSNAGLYMSDLELAFSNISGPLRYTDHSYLSSDALKLNVFEGGFNAKIQTDSSSEASQNPVIQIEFGGTAKEDALKGWVKRPELKFTKGDYVFDGHAKIPYDAEEGEASVQISLASDLRGTRVLLPSPLKKSTKKASSFNTDINVFDKHINYDFNYADILTVNVDSHDENGTAVDIRIGAQSDNSEENSVSRSSEGVAESEDAQATPESDYPYHYGLVKATGSINTLDFNQWNEIRKRYVQYLDELESSDESLITEAAIIIDKLDVSGHIIEDVDVVAHGNDTRWRFDVISTAATGKITVPVEDLPIAVDLDFVRIISDEEAIFELEDGQDTLPEFSTFHDWDLSQLSALDVELDSFELDGIDYGSWKFNVRPVEGGLHFSHLRAKVKEIKVGSDEKPAAFTWVSTPDKVMSHFIGELEIQGVSSALRAWDQEELLDAKNANFFVNASWYDHPDMVSLKNLEGEINLDIYDGNFIRGAEAGENPLLRMIALFNFDTLARRLRLDFSDLAAKGFAFDRVYGDMSFADGEVLLTTPIIVESSSSKMQMAGAVDVINEKIDSELVVTLPVAGNLAVATAFIAGLPAGLGVYVVSKMFGRQMDKVSSINYSVTGDWEDPKIKVKKIFDDTGASKKGKELQEMLPKSDEAETENKANSD